MKREPLQKSSYVSSLVYTSLNFFTDLHVLLCDFHRLQAWNRFLVKTESGISKDDAVKLKTDYLPPLADSRTQAEFEANKQKLLQCDIWKGNVKLQQYFNQNWLSAATCKVRSC